MSIVMAAIVFAATAVRTRVGVGLLPLQLRRRPDDEVRLREASRLVRRRLYVSLGSEVDWEAVSLDDACRRLQFVYEQTARWRPQLDVCVLLPPVDGSSDDTAAGREDVEALLAPEAECHALAQFNERRRRLGLPPVELCALSAALSATEVEEGSSRSCATRSSSAASGALAAHDSVCVGGTFDRLHAGHKVLLSAAALLARSRVLVGVTDDALLRDKALQPLIEPRALRAATAAAFVRAVRPGLRRGARAATPRPRVPLGALRSRASSWARCSQV